MFNFPSALQCRDMEAYAEPWDPFCQGRQVKLFTALQGGVSTGFWHRNHFGWWHYAIESDSQVSGAARDYFGAGTAEALLCAAFVYVGSQAYLGITDESTDFPERRSDLP